MKNLKQLIFLLGMLLFAQTGFAQFRAMKKFDYSILKDKTLYIPTYEVSQSFLKRMVKKGKSSKISSARMTVASYNKAWKEAMAESSYDATNYEIKAFDKKKMIKSKNKKAVLLYYYYDQYGNRYVAMMTTFPKKQVIATSIINRLNLAKKNDIRLMINILNEALNTGSELEEEGNKGYKGQRNKYKEDVVAFYDDIKNKTFLVPRNRNKNKKKAADRNSDLKQALKTWQLSKYLLTTQGDIEKKRVEGDTNSYYWKEMPYYTKSPLVTYHVNLIVSCDGDKVLFAFMGKKRLKPATLDKIQKKIIAKATKYKRQLGK